MFRFSLGKVGSVFSLLGVVLLSAACASTATPTAAPAATTPTAKAVTFANPDLMVETEWLAERLNDPKVRIVDVRKPSDYQAGHIKNSVNIDTTDLKGPMYDQGAPVKWTVLPKEKLESLLSDLGISNDTTVVAIDDAKGLWAARFFWTLEYYGHANGKARVLNGGLKKWQAEKRELTPDVPTFQKASFVAQADPSKLATKQQVLDKLGKKDTLILATIPDAEFKGGNQASAKRGGHIPGAIQLDWTENLSGGDAPVLKSATELAKQYEAIGVTKDKNVVVY